MKELDEKDVIYVANLGKLNLDSADINKYKYQLKQILNEIEKIKNLDIQYEEIMFSPSLNKNVFSNLKDEVFDTKKIISNAKNKTENYIEVRWEKND